MKINLAILGFPLNRNQNITIAGIKRLFNLTDGLIAQGLTPEIVILRQNGDKNSKKGVYRNVKYNALFLNSKNYLFPIVFLIAFFKSYKWLKYYKKNDHKNILYIYSSPTLEKLPIILTAKLLSYKIVFDLVEDEYHRFQNDKNKFPQNISIFSSLVLVKLLKYYADGGIGISLHLYKFLKSKEIKCIHIPPSVPEFRMQLPVYKNTVPKVMYCGTFGKKDCVNNLILSMKYIPKPVKLYLVGRGIKEDMDRIYTLISELGLNEQIELPGFVNEEELNIYYTQSDLLCMIREESHFANSGFPFKLGEYLSTGKPVLVTPSSDIESFLQNKISAIIIKDSSPINIAEGIIFALQNPSLLYEIGQRGKKIWDEEFNSHNNSLKLLSFFREL